MNPSFWYRYVDDISEEEPNREPHSTSQRGGQNQKHEVHIRTRTGENLTDARREDAGY